MQEQIDRQLIVIQQYVEWAKDAFDKQKSKATSSKMANYRRSLKRKKFFSTANPAAAIYGESQVGKSYLISSLLSNAGQQFSVKGHNFIEDINPIGGGSESTSLVSRFSSKYKPVNEDYPVKAVLLSPSDLVLILCECYYNDTKISFSEEKKSLSEEQINSAVSQIVQKYGNKNEVQTILLEDDIYDIRDYFRTRFGLLAEKILNSDFFTEIPFLISNVDSDQWGSIFKLLWDNNEFFSEIFERLIGKYKKLNFEHEINLSIESLLNRNGTLLDVQCLRHLDSNFAGSPGYEKNAKLMLSNGNELILEKSILCALTAELVFSQEQNSEKKFLEKMDLLDFPGARARMEIGIDDVESKHVPDLLLRGKVAYLFNKYSDEEKINVLLFCAKHEQSSQQIMPKLLNDWITNVIGKTPEERESFMSKSEVSPLFIIGTFFNVNLAYDPQHDKKEDDFSLKNRWHQRFDSTLARELLQVKTYKWFENWTTSTPNFQNIYLLRDFEKSENPSHIFEGYRQNKEEKKAVQTIGYEDFADDLKKSFLDYDFVKKHFKNPELSWNESATINKDGTKLIIKNLDIVSEKISDATNEKIKRELEKIQKDVLEEISKSFHSNDKVDELKKAKSLAGEIQLKLDKYFRGDGINYFGHFIKEMEISESETFRCFKKIIDDIEHRDIVNMGKYNLYLMQVPVRSDDTEESYFQRLCAHYEKHTDVEKNEFRKSLQKENIDLSTLIHNNDNLIQTNAQELAKALLDKWAEKMMNSESQKFLHKALENNVMDIVDMYKKMFKKHHLISNIAKQIRPYVDTLNKNNFDYDIVADISSEMLNSFINSVGYNLLTPSAIEDLKKANEENKLGLTFEEEKGFSAESVESLFNKIDNWDEIVQMKPEEMKSMPTYQNYLNWYRRLKVGFVSVCDIPNYDVNLNKRLGDIIDTCRTIKY